MRSTFTSHRRDMSVRYLWGPVAAALALLASGCASMTTPRAEVQAAKTVGVISAIADEFTSTKDGLTGLSDTERHASIESWGLDDLLTARAGRWLNLRYPVPPG